MLSLPSRTRAAAAPASRLEVCPPPSPRGPWWQRAWHWLAIGWAPMPSHAYRGVGPLDMAPLDAVKQEFLDALADVPGSAADRLVDRIEAARSMRELWHLRVEVFRLVALLRNQAVADRRLADLNRHFPTRAPRSGFGALTSRDADMWP